MNQLKKLLAEAAKTAKRVFGGKRKTRKVRRTRKARNSFY